MSTWDGIRAAERLEKEGIRCNLTLLFGLHQAVACAQAGVSLISPFVGRILDWHKEHTGRDSYPSSEDPGVVSVTRIYNYYKRYGYETEVMGASFRNLGEIIELAGCDLLTIGPKFLLALQEQTGYLPRKLGPNVHESLEIEELDIDKATFERMHAQDPMAIDKLKEGIEGFSKALVGLENLLENRLDVLEGRPRCHADTRAMFEKFDLAGDGRITREEWAGSDSVFDAIDTDGDCVITPDDMAAGIGCAHCVD